MSGVVIYIISQVCVTISLLLQGATFLVYNRHRQLGLNIFTNIFYGLSCFLLGGYVAAAMGAIAIARDSVCTLLVSLRERGIMRPSRRLDGVLLALWIILLTGGCAVTADGFLSILPYFSTLIFTIAIWQSNLLIYRCAGVAANLLGVVYNIYLFNVMGVLLQLGLSLVSMVGVVSYFLQRGRAVKNNPVK